MSAPTELLLWLDLETTGLDPELDEIVEVGAILTTTGLAGLGSYRALVQPSIPATIRMMADPAVREMHEASGLLANLANPTTLLFPVGSAERRLRGLIDQHAEEPNDRVILAGCNIDAFDRRFLERQMPGLAERLHYHGLDIGPWREASRWWGDGTLRMESKRAHRALDDALAALEVARSVRARMLADGQQEGRG